MQAEKIAAKKMGGVREERRPEGGEISRKA